MEAGEDGSWSPGPARAEAAPRPWPSEPGTGAVGLGAQTKTAGSVARSTIRAHVLPHLWEPPNEASASPRKRTAAAGQWKDGLAKGAGLARRLRPRVRRVGAEPGSRQVVPGVRGGGARGAGRGGSGQRAAGTGGTSRWEPRRGEAAREGARRRALRRSPVRGARSRCAPGVRGSRAPRLPGPYLRRPSGARSPQRCRAA